MLCAASVNVGSQRPCGGAALNLGQQGPLGVAPVTVVSPKRTQSPRLEFAIADLHCLGRELVVCGTNHQFARVAPMSASVKPFSKRLVLNDPEALRWE